MKRGLLSIMRYADTCDWLYFLAASVAVLISGANQPAQLIIFGNLLDSFNEASKSRAVRLVQFFALMYVLVGIQQFVTVTTQAFAATRVAASQARKIRQKYLAALLAKPISWYDTEDQGAVAASILESTLAIQDGLGEKLATGVQLLLAFVFGIAVSLYYAWQLTLVTIAILPVIMLLLGLASRARAKADKEATAAQGRAASTALQTLTHVRTVAAYSGERAALETYSKETELVSSQNTKLSITTGVNFAVVALCLYATWAIGLWYGSYLIRQDMRKEKCTYREDKTPANECTTGGDIMIAFLCVLFGGLSLLQATASLAAFDTARIEADRVFDIIDATHDVKTESKGDKIDEDYGEDVLKRLSSSSSDGALSIMFEDVRFAYPSRPDREIYAGVTLELRGGESTALVGPSGSGKSTAVQLLLRFYEPTSGRILLDGVTDIRRLDKAKLRGIIGLVSQEPTLFAGTVEDNIRYGRPDADHDAVVLAAKMANAHEFIETLPEKYATRVDGSKLSGGQKQRVAIARALVRQPRLLLLDEATSALDAKSEQVVQAALQTLIRSKERTTLVIAHRLSTVRSCDSIVVLGGGAVLERGTHDELMEKKETGHYYALANAQVVAAAGTDAKKVHRNDNDGHTGSAAATVVESTTATKVLEREEHLATETVAEEEDDVEKGLSPGLERGEVISWLWGMARPERPALAVGIVGSIIGGLTQPLVGYLMAEFIGVFFDTSRRDMRRESRFWALIFVAMGGCAAVGELLKAWGLSRITERVSAKARVETFESMIRQDVGWHDNHSAGELNSRLAQDCTSVKALVGQRFAQSVAIVVIIVGGLAVSFNASWQLTLVTLGIIPIIVAPIIVTATYVAKVADATNASLDAASALASEAILGIRTVRAFGMEGDISNKFDQCLALPEKAAIKKGLATGLGAGTAALAILLGASFQYYIGSIFFRKGWVDFDDLMTVLLVIIFLAFGISAASGDAIDKAEAMSAATRLKKTVALTSAIDPFVGSDASSSIQKSTAAARIELRDVGFAYPTRPDRLVFDGSFNLVVEPGQTVALCGESGSGKSTVVQLLLRFYDVTAGSVAVDGADVRDLTPKALRSRLGVVSQEPTLFAGTVEDNIRYGKPDADLAAIEEAARLANAHDFVTALPNGYQTQVGEQGIQLSGGQKQRVAIARALVRKPDVLILDEATSALDATSERVVQDALDSLLQKTKITTLIIAHRLSTIKDADAIVVLDKGKIVERGTHDQLIANQGAYFALVKHGMSSEDPAPTR